MSIATAHVFLVNPGKAAEEAQPVLGSNVQLSGNLFDMLQKLFIQQPAEKDFEIVFSHNEDEQQQNDCRDLLVAYQQKPIIENGIPIAERLQEVSDRRSGQGLLFMMVGQYGTSQRLVLSRFPADQAILAEIEQDELSVELLDRVFIRNMARYKALLLESPSPPDDFWIGTATDRQAGGEAENVSDYWIRDFLTAEFAETPKMGTRRLAEALKGAMNAHPNVELKSTIASAITLAPNMFDGKMISIRRFCEDFSFEKDVIDSVIETLPKKSLADKEFKFNSKEFKKKLPTRVMELESGARLSAPTQRFDSVFKLVEKNGDYVEYLVKGNIADERIQK